MRDEYYELGQLLGGWYHEDYEGETVEQVAAEFAYGGADVLAQVRAEIDQILAMNLDEAEMKQLLRRHGFAIYPPTEDGTYTEFLRHIRRALDEVEPPADH